LILFATVYIGFGLSTVAWHFWVLFGFYGLFMAATDGSGKAMIVDHVPKEFKATGLGLFATTTGLAALFASTCAGFLWDSYGSSFTFYFGAAGAVLSAVCLLFLKEQKRLVRLI
ncbi:MAG: MFS transporter, partial [Bdellovibrionales bacterium]|nr:MFS transporter [Oligoflexia bacterium]